MNVEKIEDIARRVGRLSVDRRDPERFFVERDELRQELRRLARDLAQAGDRRAA